MMTCEQLQPIDCEKTALEKLILSAVDSLVRMSVVQENKPDSLTPTAKSLEAACGGKCFASLQKSRQGGLWQRMYGIYSALPMFQEEGEEPSDIYSETWPRMGILLHGFVMELPTLEQSTKETGFLSWPTPKTGSNRNSRQAITDERNGGRHKSDLSLEQAIEVVTGILPKELTSVDELPERFRKMWPTPRANKISGYSRDDFSPTLEQTVKKWPTPRANDAEKRGNIADDIRNGLPAAAMWGTPKASEGKGSGKFGSKSHAHDIANKNLKEQVIQPNNSGQLNADWVECLMNFPIGYTDIDCDSPKPWPGVPAPLGLNQNWATPNTLDGIGQRSAEALQRQFETTRKGRKNPANLREQIFPDNFPGGITESGQYDYEPPRVITGQKNRAKRLKCLGNAVYPEQIYPIFAAIKAIEEMGVC